MDKPSDIDNLPFSIYDLLFTISRVVPHQSLRINLTAPFLCLQVKYPPLAPFFVSRDARPQFLADQRFTDMASA
jgi:hypothetical protein